MIKVVFKSLEKSDMVQDKAIQSLESVIEKFPDLNDSQITLTFEMHNSPTQAGPDLFTVNVQVMSGRYRDLRLERSAPNLYTAISDMTVHLLDHLNRSGDRSRVIERKQARDLARETQRTTGE